MKIPGLQALARDRFFHLLLIIGAALSLFVPFAPHAWPAAIDWRTIITLSGLMMLTKGVELSGYFDVLGRKMVRRFATERRLSLLATRKISFCGDGPGCRSPPLPGRWPLWRW